MLTRMVITDLLVRERKTRDDYVAQIPLSRGESSRDLLLRRCIMRQSALSIVHLHFIF